MKVKIDLIREELQEYLKAEDSSVSELRMMKTYVLSPYLLEMWLEVLDKRTHILEILLSEVPRLQNMIEQLEEEKHLKILNKENMNNALYRVSYCENFGEKIRYMCEDFVRCHPPDADYEIEFDGLHIKIVSKRDHIMWFDSYDGDKAEQFMNIVQREKMFTKRIKDIGDEISAVITNIIQKSLQMYEYYRKIESTAFEKFI